MLVCWRGNELDWARFFDYILYHRRLPQRYFDAFTHLVDEVLAFFTRFAASAEGQLSGQQAVKRVESFLQCVAWRVQHNRYAQREALYWRELGLAAPRGPRPGSQGSHRELFTVRALIHNAFSN